MEEVADKFCEKLGDIVEIMSKKLNSTELEDILEKIRLARSNNPVSLADLYATDIVVFGNSEIKNIKEGLYDKILEYQHPESSDKTKTIIQFISKMNGVCNESEKKMFWKQIVKLIGYSCSFRKLRTC